jgi:hypothetical protein
MLIPRKFSKILAGVIFTLGAAILVSPLFILIQRPDGNEVNCPRAVAPEGQPLIDGFEFTKYISGKKVYTLNADRLYFRDKKIDYLGLRIGLLKQAQLESVEVTFFDNQGRPASYLNSASAILDVNHKNISFLGSPSLITQDRKVLSAKSISWEDSRKQLSAQGKCFLGIDGHSYSAQTIETDPALKSFKLGV